jgi:transposase
VLTLPRALPLLRENVRQIRERTFPYRSRPPSPPDWPLYDKAQTHEASDLLELIGASVDTLVERIPSLGHRTSDGRGRPPIPTADRLRLLLWQTYRSVANRPAASELRLHALGLGIGAPFSYSSIARAYHDPEILLAAKALLWLSNEPVIGREHRFALDGTGFPTSVVQHYASLRARQGRAREEAERPEVTEPSASSPPSPPSTLGAFPTSPHDWVRNVANVGMDFGLIAGWKSWTDPTLGELSAFHEVFQKTVAIHPEAEFQLGDGLYSARWVVGEVAAAGVQARFLPRRTTSLKSLGVPAWPKSIWGLVKDPQQWLREYHERSKVEAFWWSMKSRHPGKIRKRRVCSRVVEATLRASTWNLRRLCYLHWLKGLDPQKSCATAGAA